MVSDLAGDSMRFSWSGSPTVNPFKLEAIICTTIKASRNPNGPSP